MKICTKCGQTLPLTAFRRRASRPDGHEGRCTACMAQKDRAYYAAHREQKAVRWAAYYAAHREEHAARHRAYYAAHRERLLAQGRAWTAAHREEIRARKAAAYREKKRARREDERGDA